MYEVVFEDYGFHSAYFAPAAELISHELKAEDHVTAKSSLRLVRASLNDSELYSSY